MATSRSILGATVLEASCFRITLNGAPSTTSLTDAIFTKRACLCSAQHQQEKVSKKINKKQKTEVTQPQNKLIRIDKRIHERIC